MNNKPFKLKLILNLYKKIYSILIYVSELNKKINR